MPTYLSARGLPPTSTLLAALLTLGALLAARPAPAQQQVGSQLPVPRLWVVTPPGGQVGTTVEVTLTGTDLDQPERLIFSYPGIRAEPVAPPVVPPAPVKPGKPPQPPRPASPPAGTTKFKVIIPPDTPVGIHDVRLVNRWGVSNARAFVVGDLPEVQEKEPNNDEPQAQHVPLNCTVNGSLTNPTDVDYYAFFGRRGQRVVLSCLASSIDSRFHPGLELYDSQDRLLADNRNYNFYDALTDCTLPEDGEYRVRVFQFTHTASSIPGVPPVAGDHFYRLSISTAPWIDAVFPRVVEPGKTTTVTLYGRNLPGGHPDPTARVSGRVLEKASAIVTAPSDPEALHRLSFSGRVAPAAALADGFELRVRNATGWSNPFLLTLARAPVVLDNGHNDTPETAQEVALPCEIAGQVEKRRDRDWYVFSARKGERYAIEVISSRLGAPTYMYFMLRNAANGQYLVEEPPEEPSTSFARKFFARSEDPAVYHFTVPADGRYQLLVGSRVADTVAGPRHTYSVRITPERPDFHLVAMAPDAGRPDGTTVLQGGNQAFTVLAWRHDGFVGDIVLSAEGLPPGLSCPPQTLGGEVRQGQLVVSASPGAPPWTGTIRIKGTAVIQGQQVVHEARPAGIVWPMLPQFNVPTLSRLDRELLLAVRGPAPFNLSTTIDKPAVLQGDKTTLRVKLARLWPDFKGPLQVAPEQSPQRPGAVLPVNLRVNNNQQVTLTPPKAEAALPVTVGPDVQPGTYTIVLKGQGQVPFNRDPAAKQKTPTFAVQPSTPVALTVLPKLLGTLTLSNTAPTVKVGGRAEVVVRVRRLFHYDGEFRLQVVLPAGVKGVESDQAVIPAGQDETRLVLRIPPGSAPGYRSNLTVRAAATFQGTLTTQEARFNINVVK